MFDFLLTTEWMFCIMTLIRTNVCEHIFTKADTWRSEETEMKVQKRVYNMTDRELRAYKREKRRRRALRRRCLLAAMTALVTLCLVAVGVLTYQSFQSSASTGDEELNFKYYTEVTVAYGDTLWELADEYIDYGEYEDKQEYIAEICSINHLRDSDGVRAGQKLIVPYYSSEFVK